MTVRGTKGLNGALRVGDQKNIQLSAGQLIEAQVKNMKNIWFGVLLLTVMIPAKADEDMPEFVVMELKDTSLILPNSPQHEFVPTDKLDKEIIYLDSLLNLRDAPSKSIIWLQLGICDSNKVDDRKSAFVAHKANRIRIKCWEPLSKDFRTIYVNPRNSFKSLNGNKMERMAEEIYQTPSKMDRYLKAKRDSKAYENGEHFRAVENSDLWIKKE
jgi:hypothetical protein